MKKRRILTNFHIFVLSTSIYMLFTLFLNDENYFYRKELKVRRLRQAEVLDSLKNKIETDSVEFELLKNNDVYLEKFARENFYMYRKGEDVFVVE